MTAKELMKQCEAEEKELKFREFSSETALAIGMALIEEAKNRNNKISNDIMIERKKKTAMHTGHSSLWAHYMLEDCGMNIKEKWALEPSEYAQVGGAFPIRLENCQTAIGTITCSGFNHEQDHSIIIDVCRKLKKENVL